jgi:putative thioredoxin
VPDLIKETTTQTFVGRHRGIEAPAGADRLRAPWWALPPIDTDARKGGQERQGKVKLVKMNIDEHPAIPGQMGSSRSPR